MCIRIKFECIVSPADAMLLMPITCRLSVVVLTVPS